MNIFNELIHLKLFYAHTTHDQVIGRSTIQVGYMCLNLIYGVYGLSFEIGRFYQILA